MLVPFPARPGTTGAGRFRVHAESADGTPRVGRAAMAETRPAGNNRDMKILVCSDGSERSLSVLPHAGRLAGALGAELVLARVLDPRTDAAKEVSADLEEAVGRVAARWEADLRQSLSNNGLRGEVMIPRRVWGKEVADAIHHAADETKATAVAIASRGHGALRHALLGSVAMGVISKADLPVITAGHSLRPPVGHGPYHLLITSDGSPDSRSIFAGLAPLLVPGKTRVTLFEVAVMKAQEREDEADARCRAYLQTLTSRVPEGVEVNIDVRVVPPASGIDTAIAEAADEVGADAIASSTHGHSARRHLVAGSTALGVLEKAHVPVILVKSHAAD